MSKTYISKLLRETIAQQARRRCGYCLTQEEVVGTPMQIDHIIPESLGGQTDETNLWLACTLCNDHKNDRIAALDPESGEIVRIFDPRRQQWNEHFTWNHSSEQVVGLTATGRVTVTMLNLNRPSLVRSRRLWVTVGWHPPND